MANAPLPQITCPKCHTSQAKQGQKTCTTGGCYYKFTLEQSGVFRILDNMKRVPELVHVRA